MTRALLFRKPDGSILKLDGRTVARLRRYAQRASGDPEAGGVLLGRHLRNSTDIVVDVVSEPAEDDRRTRFAFFRSKHAHQAIIDKRWFDSRGTCVYLGEWHTHPEPDPTPSRTDLAQWRRHLRSDDVDDVHIYFLIVGQTTVAVWQGARKSGRIVQLKLEAP